MWKASVANVANIVMAKRKWKKRKRINQCEERRNGNENDNESVMKYCRRKKSKYQPIKWKPIVIIMANESCGNERNINVNQWKLNVVKVMLINVNG